MLSEEEGLVLRAVEAFHDVEEVRRRSSSWALVTLSTNSDQ